MSEIKKQPEPNFCSTCGLSLVKLDSWHSSRNCNSCGKEVFFVRHGEDGGIKVEKGEKIHIPNITLSLDPSQGGQFSRYGLEGFIKQLFLEEKLSETTFIEKLKESETKIDKELMNLDCIQHCDLESNDGPSKALEILDKEKMSEYKYKLLRSSSLRSCYTAIESGNALDAAFSYYHAGLFHAYSILEQYHFKEIIWLGYSCYIDLAKNEKASYESSKQQTLIRKLQPKISSLNDDFLYALAKDDDEIAPRLGVQGISENTLKTILEHELNRRKDDKEEEYRNQEIKLKKKGQMITVFGILFTLTNTLILALYKDWLS